MMKLPQIPHDKCLHIIYGFGVAAIVTPLAWALGLPGPGWWGGAAAVIVGFGKEIYDKKTGKGKYDLVDAYVTVIGGLGFVFAAALPL